MDEDLAVTRRQDEGGAIRFLNSPIVRIPRPRLVRNKRSADMSTSSDSARVDRWAGREVSTDVPAPCHGSLESQYPGGFRHEWIPSLQCRLSRAHQGGGGMCPALVAADAEITIRATPLPVVESQRVVNR